MKRIKAVISLTLCISFLMTFCSCKHIKKDAKELLSNTEIDSVIEKIDKEIKEGISKIPDNTAEIIENVLPNITKSIDVTVEKIISTDGEISEPNPQNNISDIIFNSNHTALSSSKYYQYNSLSGTAKRVYDAINNTVQRSANKVDLSAFNVSEKFVLSVFKKFLADNPQYFYVSRCCMMVYARNQKAVRAVMLLYTDGAVTDEFNENFNFIKKANRDTINRKIGEIETAVSDIISKIPSNVDEVIKEKKIHDYIDKTLTYDSAAADSMNSREITLPHAFDLYGAVVEHSAVCEGYSKMFQYLCYCVGINATQVFGTSNGGNHMWNTVKIDNCWYQVDVTWDDSDGVVAYDYFNLMDESMLKDHIVDDTDIAVPKCASNAKSFNNTFAFIIDSLSYLPRDYEKIISNVILAGDDCIYFYFGKDKISTQTIQRYISRYITRKSSDFYKCLAGQGKRADSLLGQLGDYIIITIK